MSTLWEWINMNEVLLAWLGGIGAFLFLGSLVIVPVMVAYMPEDYFVRIHTGIHSRSLLRKILHMVKNIAGVILFVAGVLMLILPGQGVLTIVIGLSLVDFPGKQRLEIKLVQCAGVRRSISWIRRKAGRPEMMIPESS